MEGEVSRKGRSLGHGEGGRRGRAFPRSADLSRLSCSFPTIEDAKIKGGKAENRNGAGCREMHRPCISYPMFARVGYGWARGQKTGMKRAPAAR